MAFNKTLKQVEAIDTLNGPAKHILLYGGSRSGKSLIIVRNLILRAVKCKSRHVILRKHFAHVKQSIWLDTIPKVLELCFPELKQRVKFNNSDWFLSFPNGSEIWIGGLDDKERTEKILGREFSTIFLNESSEIDWNSRNIALTRLSEKNDLKKKIYADCNPPRRSHWTYKFFIEKIDPVTDKPHDVKCASLLMNPKDNADNIDPDYITETLENLPFVLRKRFLEGEFWSDDTDIFQPHWLRPGLTGGYIYTIQACDPAISEKDTADEAAICTIGVKSDGSIEELETVHGRYGFNSLILNMIAAEARHKPRYAGVETVAFQKAIEPVIRKERPGTVWRSLDDYGIKSDVDKVRRAISISYLLERGLVTVNTPALVKQLLEFKGEDEKNDLADSFIMALQIYKRLWVAAKKEPEDFQGLSNVEYQRQRVARFQEAKRKAAKRKAKGQGIDPQLGSRW